MDAIVRIIEGDVWILVPLGVFTFISLGIVTDAIRKVAQTKAKETTRREIAAYVAEGSMTTDEAERLLAAGTKYSKSDRA